MSPLALLAVLGLLQLSVLEAVDPSQGGDALGERHDIELTVSAGSTGKSELDFLLLGEHGSLFSLVNYNNGTLQLRGHNEMLFEINDSVKKEEGAEPVLLESSETFLRKVHAARMRLRRLRHGRRLLEEPADTMEIMNDHDQLAASARAKGKLSVCGGAFASTASGHVIAYGQRQWKMLVHEDFHQDTVDGWENKGENPDLPPNNAISECSSMKHTYSDYFLGAYTKMDTTKTFRLPAHTHVRIQARVHFIDNWQGESVYLKIGDDLVWTQSHFWCDQLLESLCRPRHPDDPDDTGLTINVCGSPNYPDYLSMPLDVVLAHSDDELVLTFGSNVETEGATWGIDDLRVSVM